MGQLGGGFDPADHRQSARGAAEFRRLAAQRCVFRLPGLADDLGAALLSRLLPACARRTHSAVGHRGSARHHGGPVLGFGRYAARPVESRAGEGATLGLWRYMRRGKTNMTQPWRPVPSERTLREVDVRAIDTADRKLFCSLANVGICRKTPA